ncbi:MAG: ROK family protein [Lentisphaerae bacterium]|nr:MAG: ROK family protein [Lentisphaerota bacterium]
MTGKYFVSIDLGGTNIKCCIGDASGHILDRRSCPTRSDEGPEAVIRRMADLVNDLTRKNRVKAAAAGIGVPGLCDLERGITRFLPNLHTQWRDVPVRKLLEPAIACPIYLLNDVRLATLGELTFGHGKGKSRLSMAFFALGTGVGGGLVLDGRLRLGPLGAAGELGHQIICPDGARCGCGSRGCLETLCSGPAICANAIRLMLSGQAPRLFAICEGNTSKVTCETIAEAARQGDENIISMIHHTARYLGIAMANVAVMVHPELIVIGGGVSLMGDILLEPAIETMRARVGMLPADSIEVLPSKLGDQAGALGGIALAMQKGKV